MMRHSYLSDLIILTAFGCLLFGWTNAEAGVGPWPANTNSATTSTSTTTSSGTEGTSVEPTTKSSSSITAGPSMVFKLSSAQIAIVLATFVTSLMIMRSLLASPWATAFVAVIAVLAVLVYGMPALTGSTPEQSYSFLANTFAAFSSNPLFATVDQLAPSETSDWIRHVNDSAIPRLEKNSKKSQYWLASGLSEQATILHFSRLAVNLIAIGAPSNLVRRAYQAALDEIGHAQLAFGLAEESDPMGHAHAPGTFEGAEERHAFESHDLDHVCMQNLGGAGTAETLSLFHVSQHLHATNVGLEARERDVLQVVLREETQHILLAWDIVHWCVEAKAKRSGGDSNIVKAFEGSLKNVADVALKALLERYEGTEAMIETEKFVRAALPIALGQSKETPAARTTASTSPLVALRQQLLQEFASSR